MMRFEFLIVYIVLAELMLINTYSYMLTHENFANDSLAHSIYYDNIKENYLNTCTTAHFTGINPNSCIMIA